MGSICLCLAWLRRLEALAFTGEAREPACRELSCKAVRLIRVRRIRFRDPDLVIMKSHQSIRELYFWHVAARAVCAGHWTGFCIAVLCRLPGHAWRITFRGMTRQTLRVIGPFIRNKILVRVMAGNAANAGIGTVEALAVGQAIWLKPHIHWTPPIAAHNRFPGAMALSAKV